MSGGRWTIALTRRGDLLADRLRWRFDLAIGYPHKITHLLRIPLESPIWRAFFDNLSVHYDRNTTGRRRAALMRPLNRAREVLQRAHRLGLPAPIRRAWVEREADDAEQRHAVRVTIRAGNARSSKHRFEGFEYLRFKLDECARARGHAAKGDDKAAALRFGQGNGAIAGLGCTWGLAL